MGSVRIDRLDHLVLTVADIDAMVEFYIRALGMKAVTFGTGRTALAFGRSKIKSNGPTLRTPRSAVLAWAAWVCSRTPVITCKG